MAKSSLKVVISINIEVKINILIIIILPPQHSLWSGGHTVYVLHVPTPSEYPIATTTQDPY